MFAEPFEIHELLYESPAARKLGEIHCKILISENLLDRKSKVQNKSSKEFDLSPVEYTTFGLEIGGNFIQWWVRQNILVYNEINERISKLKPSLDILKRQSLTFNESKEPQNYKELISDFLDFAKAYEKEINVLLEFVDWLGKQDSLNPCVLFSHPPWSTTELSERILRFDNGGEGKINRCIEIVFGLFLNGYTLGLVRIDMEGKWADSVDPEYAGPCPITFESAFPRAKRKIFNEFALYFQKIRDSVELLESEIIAYTREEIIDNKEVLRKLIYSILPANRLETEIYDFKKTIPAWHNTNNISLKIDFACNVAAYANNRGGILIIGITDDRKIIGVNEIENRMKQCKRIIDTYLDSQIDKLKIDQVILKNEDEDIKTCILIKIPQQKKVIGVKSENESYFYPFRELDGIVYKNRNEVAQVKKDVSKDNFFFARDLLYLI
jgi:uncharacterized protein YuzE